MKLLIAAALSAACAASAHHSFAMFDMAHTKTIDGTIKQFLWQNPHSWIDLYVTDSSGKQNLFSIEMGSPAGLYKAGWRQSNLKPGDHITVVMHPLNDGRNGGSIVGAVLADGQKLGDTGVPGVGKN